MIFPDQKEKEADDLDSLDVPSMKIQELKNFVGK
jgi:hypothetical protein